MAEIQVGDALQWGIDETFTGYVLQSQDVSRSARVKREIPDETGVIKTVIYQDEVLVHNVEMVVASGTTLPSVGDTLLGGSTEKYLVDEINERRTSEGEVRLSMVLKQYPGITLV